MSVYSSKEVCRVSGCTHRQLQYWEIKGYLSPQLGSRNVREYSSNDIKVIQRIIEHKKSGKSLGEAFVTSDLEITQTNPYIQSLMSKAMPLEIAWVETNQKLLNILEDIHSLEASIPRFPYSIYEADKLEALKTLQQKAVLVKEQKDDYFHQLQSLLIEQPTFEKAAEEGLAFAAAAAASAAAAAAAAADCEGPEAAAAAVPTWGLPEKPSAAGGTAKRCRG